MNTEITLKLEITEQQIKHLPDDFGEKLEEELIRSLAKMILERKDTNVDSQECTTEEEF